MSFTAVVLAAGQGTRMRSRTPKVLHPLCGRPMVLWPVAAAQAAGAERVVVVDGPDRALESVLPGGVEIAVQERPLGTGDAVRAAGSARGDGAGTVIVLYGDVPLIGAELICGARGAPWGVRGGRHGRHDGARRPDWLWAHRARRGRVDRARRGDQGAGARERGGAGPARGQQWRDRVRGGRARPGAASAGGRSRRWAKSIFQTPCRCCAPPVTPSPPTASSTLR